MLIASPFCYLVAMNKDSSAKQKKDGHLNLKAGALSLLLQFIPVYCFWLVLSGRFQPFYLITGAITCLLVCYFNSRCLQISGPPAKQASFQSLLP
jgi:hypothetical protein